MVIVPHKDVVEGKFLGNMVNQFLDIWVHPNIEQNINVLDENQFRAALLELYPSRGTPKILLNGDARFHFELEHPKLRRKDVGKNLVDINEIKDLKWIDSKTDPNTAKVMIVRFDKDFWIVNFDFRYNLAKAKNRLQRVLEFQSSITSLFQKREFCPNILVYLLWSYAELIWDIKLHLIAKEVTDGQHSTRILKLNNWKNLISDQSFFEIFDELGKNKDRARYGEQNLPKSFNKVKLKSFFRILKIEMKTIPLTF